MPAKPKQDERLQAFRGEYGRLCVLVAQALTRGHETTRVVEAAWGKGNQSAPVYVGLRRQRKRMDAALDRCTASGEAIVRAGVEVNVAVSDEWMIALPAFSQKMATC